MFNKCMLARQEINFFLVTTERSAKNLFKVIKTHIKKRVPEIRKNRTKNALSFDLCQKNSTLYYIEKIGACAKGTFFFQMTTKRSVKQSSSKLQESDLKNLSLMYKKKLTLEVSIWVKKKIIFFKCMLALYEVFFFRFLQQNALKEVIEVGKNHI